MFHPLQKDENDINNEKKKYFYINYLSVSNIYSFQNKIFSINLKIKKNKIK